MAPLTQTCKSMNFLRRKRAACFLTAIMNYHTRGQRRKTIIDYHDEEFEQAQTVNDG